MPEDRALELAGSNLGQILLFCGRILFREGGVFVRFSDSAIIMEFVRFSDSAIIIYSSFQQLLIVMAEKTFIDAILSVNLCCFSGGFYFEKEYSSVFQILLS